MNHRTHKRTNAYSENLRKKIVEALNLGTGKREASHAFGVSLSSIKRYAKWADEEKSLVPRKRPGSRPKIGEDARRLLEIDLETHLYSTHLFDFVGYTVKVAQTLMLSRRPKRSPTMG